MGCLRRRPCYPMLSIFPFFHIKQIFCDDRWLPWYCGAWVLDGERQGKLRRKSRATTWKPRSCLWVVDVEVLGIMECDETESPFWDEMGLVSNSILVATVWGGREVVMKISNRVLNGRNTQGEYMKYIGGSDIFLSTDTFVGIIRHRLLKKWRKKDR